MSICLGSGKMKRKGKRWTKEELLYLEESWGVISRKGIARKLGRTVLAVQLKAQRLGLGDPLLHLDGITISQLAQVLNLHYGIIRNWRDKYCLPVKKKVVAHSEAVQYVCYTDFWKWAEKNKQMIDFSRIERLSMGPEPNWVDEKRKADQIKKLHKPNPHNTPWSSSEDSRLRWMLKQYKYTYPEISKELGRSQGAVKRRMLDLGIKARPIRLPNHNKYTKKEEKLIIEMMENGYCFEEIATRLGKGRSALGVRGKVERMGYKFRNGVPYKEEIS